MIDFSMHYSVDWHVYRVNTDTWDETEELPNVVNASVDRDCTDDVPLLETSSLNFDIAAASEFRDGWYRIIADVTQGASCMRIPISTNYYHLTNETFDYGIKSISAEGQSSLYPASELRMQDGAFVPKDSNGADWVVRHLRSCISAPVRKVDEKGFVLKRHVVYDSNDTVLSAVWSVLDAGKWCMQIDGNGIVNVMPKPKTPMLVISDSNTRLLEPEVKRAYTRKGIPNRYIVRDGNEEVVVVNDDPNSITSTVNVGHYVDAQIDTNPYLLAGESIYTYARRKLEELSTIAITYDYTREYYPGVYPMSLLEFTLPNNGLNGELRVARQKLTLDQGIEVSETATEERKYWRRR